MMFVPGIVIFERTSRWEAGIKRHFHSRDVWIRPCRKTADVTTAWQQAPGSLTVIDLSADPETGLRLTRAAATQTPPAPVLALITTQQADLEWPLRELGAISVVQSNITARRLAALCEQYRSRSVQDGATMKVG